MPAFFVHWNRIRKRVVVHIPKCGACNDGQGMHRGKIAAGRGDTYDWIAAKSYDDATSVATERSKAIKTKWKNCGMCSPHLSRAAKISN